MPVRARSFAVAISLALLAGAGLAPAANPASAAVVAKKVAIIVGPVGSMTAGYRTRADQVAAAATAAGATVVKAYSPTATWARVRAAVNGANVIVYFGHGNGYPNPYSSTENRDRVNGWGLNRTETGGDVDNWGSTMVYCGEKALLGTLTAADGAAQWSYCGGKTNTDRITPAPGFTMVYGQAHYAPGFGERYDKSDPLTTLAEAQARVRHYSYPVLALGARGYFATAYGDADDIVRRVLTRPGDTFAQTFRAGEGYSPSTFNATPHPDVTGAQVWVQRTVAGSLHFGQPDYWYAFAGNPNVAPNGTTGPRILIYRPSPNAINALTTHIVTATFDRPMTNVNGTNFYLRRLSDLTRVDATVTYNSYWKRAELRPTVPLDPGATYVVTAAGGLTSTAGQPFIAYSWRFTVSPP